MHPNIGRFFLPGVLLVAFYLVVPPPVYSQIVQMRDIGLETSFQDTFLGYHKKGRAGIAADFDLDGFIDYYIGNPGNESFVMRSLPGVEGRRKFELQQILLEDSIAWGGVAFDYDNDGDHDIFITCGANEGIGYDALFRNDWILDGEVTGNLEFTDVTDIAGVAGPLPPTDEISFGPANYHLEDDHCGDWRGEPEVMPPADVVLPPGQQSGTPVRTASANAVIADYDQDGDNDIFVSGNIHRFSDPDYPALIGRNTLWKNNGDGTFSDATYEAGLGALLAPSRNSTFIDYDNDGDMDLWENNFGGSNHLWRNNGDGTFQDVTDAASYPGHDLHYPWKSFASAAADLNNDGWEDLIGFMRGSRDRLYGSPYPDGHALWINLNGMFRNRASTTIVNDNYVLENGVMGCLVGDVSGDGFPDIFVGNGGPQTGVENQFFVSAPSPSLPWYVDNTSMIDVPADIPPGFPDRPYPYRTHGVSLVDYDNDGAVELAVVNGGMSLSSPFVGEPNRLFMVRTAYRYSWFKVRLLGDGVSVARDPIGAKVKVEVVNDLGESWHVYRTLYAGSAFPAQSGLTLHFGLADATQIVSVTIRWPDGLISTIQDGLSINGSMNISYRGAGAVAMTTSTNESNLTTPEEFQLRQNYPNPFNPSTTIDYSVPYSSYVKLEVFNILGERVRVLADGLHDAGYHSVVFDAEGLPSGNYFYRLQAGGYVETKQLVLVR